MPICDVMEIIEGRNRCGTDFFQVAVVYFALGN
jgi:hypothetical protein